MRPAAALVLAMAVGVLLAVGSVYIDAVDDGCVWFPPLGVFCRQ